MPGVEAPVRAMAASDVAAAASIERGIQAEPWTAAQFAASLAAGHNCLVVEVAGQVAGFAVLMCVLDEGEVLNIGLRGDCQGRGLGRLLLDALVAEGRRRGVARFLLEVRAGNAAARRLYSRAGFTEFGVRQGYYGAPGGREDAIMMEYLPERRAACG